MNVELEAVLEGMLFVVGEDGLTLEQIQNVLDISEEDSKKLIVSLKNKYNDVDRGIRINILGNTFKLTTKKEHREYYQKLIENPETNTLSQSALETLAIIVYNEPITRIEVDEIRGVNSRDIVRKLVAKGLIKENGRSEAPGRPILYSTTKEFLDYFGLSSKEELPEFEIKKEEKIVDNVDLFKSKYVENSFEQ